MDYYRKIYCALACTKNGKDKVFFISLKKKGYIFYKIKPLFSLGFYIFIHKGTQVRAARIFLIRLNIYSDRNRIMDIY